VNAFSVVVKHGQSKGFVQFSNILVESETPELSLEAAEEAFHEPVLPGASSGATAKGNLVTVTGKLVLVTQVFGALVAV